MVYLFFPYFYAYEESTKHAKESKNKIKLTKTYRTLKDFYMEVYLYRNEH